MRLINTHTLEFEEFEGQNIPPYAILSHRWEEQEVLFKDVERGTAVQKKGWQKITKCCEMARTDGLSYVWVDTCCIDKSSSAELSEAINSMFRWYQSSKRCYVYLYDVHLVNSTWQEWESFGLNTNKWVRLKGWEARKSVHPNLPMLSRDFVAEFCSSVWFTRGWTLQELLASENMIFLGSRWQILGTKDFLCGVISSRTSIPTDVLIHQKRLYHVTIAERMSWAAKRDTTRIEDRAYSLMGIFSVNMPMLYGEGEVAFTRLQEEILKRSTDQSILLWESSRLSVLAKTPDAFQSHLSEPPDLLACILYPFRPAKLMEEKVYQTKPSDDVYTMTQIGMSINLYLIPWHHGTYLAPLNIQRSIVSGGDRLSHDVACIFLRPKVEGSHVHRVRFRGEAITYINKNACLELQFNPFTNGLRSQDDTLKRHCTVAHENVPTYVPSLFGKPDLYTICFRFQNNNCWGPDGMPGAQDVVSRQKWSVIDPKIEMEVGRWGPLAIFRVFHPPGQPSYIYVGFDQYFRPSFVQKEWDHPVDFDDAVGARPDSPELSRVLDPWIFNRSVQLGTNETQKVLQSYEGGSIIRSCNTMIPGIQLYINRLHTGCFFEFEKPRLEPNFRLARRWIRHGEVDEAV